MRRSLNEILFSLYISLVFALTYSAQFTLEPLYLVLLLFAFFVLFYFLSRPIFNLAGKVTLLKKTCKKEKVLVAAVFAISIVYLGLWFCYYYPGWFTGDSLGQLAEAESGIYTDWHPVLHTLLAFTIPLKITRGWMGSIVLFQIIWFSLSLAYMVKTLLRHGNTSFALIAFAFILFNPVTGAIMKQPWKDCSFSTLSIFMMAFALNIIFDKDWIRKPINLVSLIVISVVATIVRHNALLFTIPLAIAIIHYIKPKHLKIIYPVSVLVLFLLIKGPLYSALGVTDPGNRTVETMGLPMIIIGETVKESPELLDEDVLDFAYSIASKETWNEYYYSGDFNSIKFDGGIDTAPIEAAGRLGVLQIMLRCFAESPKYALKGLIDGTKMVYAISGNINWTPEFIPPKLLSPIQSTPLRYVVLYVGLGNLIVVLFALQRKNGWLAFPLLIHNFGTMLLLTGPDYRFFYLTYPISWMIIFHLIFKKQNSEIHK